MESHSRPQQSFLKEAIQNHLVRELVSFHTPGHKGRVFDSQATGVLSALSPRHDLTELPGLDDLTAPATVIKQLEESSAVLWKTRASFISVNGASAGLVASILSIASRGTKLLVPRNAHKSVVNALVLSGLEPIWYEPSWNRDWQVFGPVETDSIRSILAVEGWNLAGAVVVSPTYPGALSAIGSIASLCHQYYVPLIVDEAHGAHQLPDSHMPESAIEQGADLVVHSLHKTLGALTQTGLIHLPDSSMLTESAVRNCLNIMQSTSPSYLLMLSIESAVNELQNPDGMQRLQQLADRARLLRRKIASLNAYDIYDTEYGVDPLHICLAHRQRSVNELNDFLVDRGIFAEAIFGRGLLLMLGVGTVESDLNQLVEALQRFADIPQILPKQPATRAENLEVDTDHFKIDQAMSPRAASLAPSHMVSSEQALDKIASECIAPCPPGMPICVPGQKLSKDVLKKIEQIERDEIRIVS